MTIQDRSFTSDGQLFFPSAPTVPNAPNPNVQPEFFGDFIMVNDMAWPKLEVEPRKYRFRLLNASDSRFFDLDLDAANEKFYQIGTEQGFLDKPVALDRLVIAPGERADIVIDFTGDSGKEIVLKNLGTNIPSPGLPEGPGDPDVSPDSAANPATTGQVMKFAVNKPISGIPNATIDTNEADGLNTSLRDEPISTPPQTGSTRKLALFEGRDGFGRIQPLLGVAEPTVDAAGNTVNGSLGFSEPVTERPALNTTEVWEFYNATEDAHPIHLHLVSFQLLNRESFTGTITPKEQPQHDDIVGVGGVLSNIILGRDVTEPAANERDWKDTIIAPPGQVTRIVTSPFDRPGEYVWHCHILSHEDHEMMRPFEVVVSPQPAADPLSTALTPGFATADSTLG